MEIDGVSELLQGTMAIVVRLRVSSRPWWRVKDPSAVDAFDMYELVARSQPVRIFPDVFVDSSLIIARGCRVLLSCKTNPMV